MIYVPNKDYACYVVQNENTVRAYHTMPTLDSEVDYTDYYIHSDYMSKEGSQSFSRYQTLPQCVDISQITDEPYYRVDFPDILLMFVIWCFFTVWIPWKIFCRLFRRLN